MTEATTLFAAAAAITSRRRRFASDAKLHDGDAADRID